MGRQPGDQGQSEQRLKARKLKSAGLSYSEIGKKFGVSRQRAQQLVAPTPVRRKEIIESKENKCEWCGATGVTFHLHHSNYATEPDTLLCIPCHMGGTNSQYTQKQRWAIGFKISQGLKRHRNNNE